MVGNNELAMEERIIAAPISESRRESFLAEYVANRTKAGVLVDLFRRNGALEKIPEGAERFQFGFRNMLPYKGPFVDDTNWLEMRSWEFAVAMERFLFARFEELLQDLPVTTSPPLDWTLEAVLNSYDAMVNETRSLTGRTPSALFISDPDSAVITDTYTSDRLIPDWKLSTTERHIWLLGVYNEIPIIRLPTSDRRAIYAVDIGSLAKLQQFDGITFELRQITDERAAGLLDEHNVRIELPEGAQDTRAARIRQLRLRVEMDLWESLRLVPLNRGSGTRALISD